MARRLRIECRVWVGSTATSQSAGIITNFSPDTGHTGSKNP